MSPVTSNISNAERVRPLLVGGASLALGIAGWWALAELSDIPAYLLPSPGEVVDRAVGLWNSGSLQLHTAQTLAEVGQGAAIGAVIGVVLAMVFYHVPWINRLLMPIIVVAQVTPKISIAPLIVLWIGLGIESKITLVALVVFYPILINMLARLQAIPPTMRDLAKITGMSPLRRAFRIEFPFTFPAIAAGLKIGLLAGVTAAVIGEFIGATAGLGYLEKQGQDNDDIRLVMVALILLSLIGYVLWALVGLVEKKVTRRYE
ncbi:ABC transporter permease [Salinibacterium sp. dk2585]|nr:ABC transporter permease [Salinibacterium sp. dk2585]TXK52729.1 ABC transporter permease [Salinibacterium sp. dk5596]